jgi:hypothetical protein
MMTERQVDFVMGMIAGGCGVIIFQAVIGALI